MAVVRVHKRENPFVQVDKTAINDNRLSWKAKGILVYLISKPHDWKVRVKDLVKHATDGKASVYSGLDELERYGYMSRKQTRNEDGTFGELEYTVYEIPIEIENSPHTENQNTDFSPHTDFPYAEKWDTENRKHSNKDMTNKDYTNNDKNNNNNNNKVNSEQVEINHEQDPIVVVAKKYGLSITKRTLNKWRRFETQDENIILAVQDSLEKPDIKNLIGYITRMLECGYTPSKPSESVSKDKWLPEYIAKQSEGKGIELDGAKQKEALELLFKLKEISEQEYKERLEELNIE